MTTERLAIDRVLAWRLLSQLDDCGDVRRYYIAPAPLRLLVVCRHGLTIHACQGHVVDAAIGLDQGMPGFARVKGQLQTKITIYRILDQAEATDRLSRVLRMARRDSEDAPG